MAGNDIFVNSMSRTYSLFLQSQFAETKAKGAMNFRQLVEASEGSDKAGVVSKEEMSLEEYKEYIHQKISQIPMHPSQIYSSVSVHITDEGFAAMQKDPEYEKWVLDTLKANFSFNDPWSGIYGGSFSVHHFGATKEECHGEGWHMGFQGGKGSALFDEEAEDSFWEKRAKRHKKFMELEQEAAEDKKIMGKVLKEAAVRRGDYEGMFAQEAMAQSISFARLLLNPELTQA